MYHAFSHQIAIGAAELPSDLESVALRKLAFLCDVLAEIAVGAVLEDQVVVVGGLDGFDEFDHVLVV